jgi:hypothetical protein
LDGRLSITRAFGHSRYKAKIPESERVLSAKPQVYIWEKKIDMMMMLCSDSFTEAICTKPKLVIKNILENQDTMKMLSNCLEKNAFDLVLTVNSLCEDQVEKFHFPYGYAGDNTSIILIDFSAPASVEEKSKFIAAANLMWPQIEDANEEDDNEIIMKEEVEFKSVFLKSNCNQFRETHIKRPSICLVGADNVDEAEQLRPRTYSRDSDRTSTASPISTPTSPLNKICSRRGSMSSSSTDNSRSSSRRGSSNSLGSKTSSQGQLGTSPSDFGTSPANGVSYMKSFQNTLSLSEEHVYSHSEEYSSSPSPPSPCPKYFTKYYPSAKPN